MYFWCRFSLSMSAWKRISAPFPLDALPFMLDTARDGGHQQSASAPGFGARMGGFNLRESLRVGVCMVSRGEVGLIIISIGLSSGLLDGGSELYASLFMVILVDNSADPAHGALGIPGQESGQNRQTATRLAGAASSETEAMMKLVILITSNVENGPGCRRSLAGWRARPASPFVKSFGLYSLQRKIMRDSLEVPLHIASSMNSLMAYVLREMEHTNHVLLSVVPKESVPTLLDEARAVMGDLLEPNNGVAFVVPLDQAIGVRNPDDDGE